MTSPFRGIFVISLAFTIGLLVGEWGPSHFSRLCLAVAVLIIVFAISRVPQATQICNILLIVLWLLLGWTRATKPLAPSLPPGRAWIEGRVRLPVEDDSSGRRIRLSLEKWRQGERVGKLTGGAVAHLPTKIPVFAGDKVRLIGELASHPKARNPGEFDANAYWEIRNVHYQIRSSRQLEIISSADWLHLPQRWIDQARRYVAAKVRQVCDASTAPLAIALLTGDRSDWDRAARDQFAQSGLMYLVAISGLHVALFAAMLYPVFSLLHIPRMVSLLLTLILVWIYVPFTGANPPVLRAAVMLTLLTGGQLFKRQYRSGYSLCLAYLLLLFLHPEGLRDIGFQLSFAGTAGVLYAWNVFHRWRSPSLVIKLPTYARAPVSQLSNLFFLLLISLGAWLINAPFIIWHFGRLPWFAPLIALPALGLVYLVLIAGWLMVMFSTLPFLPEVFGASLHTLLIWLELLIKSSLRHLPASDFLSAGDALVAAIATLVWLYLLLRMIRRPLPSLLIGSLATASLLLFKSAWLPDNAVKLGILDVGQGDGILIRSGDKTVVIDGGPGDGNPLIQQLRLTGCDDVDLLILTHGDADHCSAAIQLAHSIPVRAALVGPEIQRDQTGYQAVQALMNAGTPLYAGCKNMTVILGALGKIDVLYPLRDVNFDAYSDNELSLVLLWEVNDVACVFPGDIPSGVEYYLAKQGVLSDIHLLLAAHHGSRYSTSSVWLESLKPEIVAISCGRGNPYGHPAPEVLERIGRIGAVTYRTDQEGALLFQIKNRGIAPLAWSSWW